MEEQLAEYLLKHGFELRSDILAKRTGLHGSDVLDRDYRFALEAMVVNELAQRLGLNYVDVLEIVDADFVRKWTGEDFFNKE